MKIIRKGPLKTLQIECSVCRSLLEITMKDIHRTPGEYDYYGRHIYWFKCPCCKGKTTFPTNGLDDFK